MSGTCQAGIFDESIACRIVQEREWTWPRCLATVVVVCGLLGHGISASAQTQAPQTLTVIDAIELARQNYPSLKEVRARSVAAEEGVDVARTAYIPRLDALWQANRATHNNVFGLVLRRRRAADFGTRAWHHVVGRCGQRGRCAASWQDVDFGLRKANVQAASAQASQAQRWRN